MIRLFSKANRAFIICIYILSLPIVLLIISYCKLTKIKFLYLRTDRIGHFITEIVGAIYWKTKIKQSQEKKIILTHYSISNEEIYKIINNYTKIYRPNKFLFFLLYDCIKFWGIRNFEKNYNCIDNPDIYFEKNRITRTSYFQKISNIVKKNIIDQNYNLKKIKNYKGQKWICIHNRDSKYLTTGFHFPEIELNHKFRNFDIEDLKKTINFFTKKGYFVFRIGKISEKRLNIKNKNFFDYSNSYLRTDKMDLFLLSNCEFYFGSDSGAGVFTFLFGRPQIIFNFNPCQLHLCTKYNFFPIIFQLIKYKGKFLTFGEIFKNHNDAADYNYFLKNNLNFIKNNETEIFNLGNETLKYIENNCQYSSEDEKINLKFWDLYKKHTKSELLGDFNPKISPFFLKKYNHLIR